MRQIAEKNSHCERRKRNGDVIKRVTTDRYIKIKRKSEKEVM